MSNAQSPRAAKSRPSTTAKAAVKGTARSAARKAVVLGRIKADSGKTYQVLSPELAPKHLTMDDIAHAVELMVAAR